MVEEADQESTPELGPRVRALLNRLYRDPRYLLIGAVERYGQDRISFVESCTVISAAGDLRGQLLLNREYARHGRPDGERPYGYDSLLDYYLARTSQCPAGPELGEEDIAALRDESWQYYVRRNFAFQLGDFAQARDDAEHNLAIWRLIHDSSAPEESKWSYLKWWPWIERDRAIAQALLDLQEGALSQAATELYRAQRRIEDFGRRHADQYQREEGDGQHLCEAMLQHLHALVELLREDHGLPVSLEEQLDQATARGDTKEIERLRAEMIRRAMEGSD